MDVKLGQVNNQVSSESVQGWRLLWLQPSRDSIHWAWDNLSNTKYQQIAPGSSRQFGRKQQEQETQACPWKLGVWSTDKIKTLETLNKQLSLMLLGAECVSASNSGKGEATVDLWPGLKRGESGDKERGHILELPSVEGCWQAAPGGKGAEPLHFTDVVQRRVQLPAQMMGCRGPGNGLGGLQTWLVHNRSTLSWVFKLLSCKHFSMLSFQSWNCLRETG